MSDQETPATGDVYAAEIERLVGDAARWLTDLDPAVRARPPDPGGWTVTENLAHMAEFLRYWADQAVQVAARPGGPFGRTQDDPDRIAWVATHGDESLEQTVEALRSAGRYAAVALRSIPSGAWTATGLHPTRGAMEVDQIVELFMLRHLRAHLDQAGEAAGASAGGA